MYECPVCGMTFHHDDNPLTECGPNNSLMCCPECAAEVDALAENLPEHFMDCVLGIGTSSDLSIAECYILDNFTVRQIADWVNKVRKEASK